MDGPLVRTADGNQQHCCPWCAEQETKGSAAAAAAAVTTHSGDQIFLSQTRGVLLAVDTATMQIADAVKVGVAKAHPKQHFTRSLQQAVAALAAEVFGSWDDASCKRGALLSSRPLPTQHRSHTTFRRPRSCCAGARLATRPGAVAEPPGLAAAGGVQRSGHPAVRGFEAACAARGASLC